MISILTSSLLLHTERVKPRWASAQLFIVYMRQRRKSALQRRELGRHARVEFDALTPDLKIFLGTADRRVAGSEKKVLMRSREPVARAGEVG